MGREKLLSKQIGEGQMICLRQEGIKAVRRLNTANIEKGRHRGAGEAGRSESSQGLEGP